MTYGNIGAWLRAAFIAPVDKALDDTLSDLGAVAFLPAGVSGGFPDAGDTDDPLVDLERRVAATREG